MSESGISGGRADTGQGAARPGQTSDQQERESRFTNPQVASSEAARSGGCLPPEPLEVSEPVDVVAWLRALPMGTVLLDRSRRGWQVRIWHEHTHCYDVESPREFEALLMAGSEEAYDLRDDDDAAMVAGEGPWQVAWMPPVGSAS